MNEHCVMHPVLCSFSNEAMTTVVSKFVHGPGIDEPLAVKENGTIYFYLQDGLGSVSGMVNSSGSFVNSYDYREFGSNFASQITAENPYRYTGREFVETASNSTELYYYRARYYRPDLGRFISKDPMGMVDGTNQFVYVQNDPIEYDDPIGYFSIDGDCGCIPTSFIRTKIEGYCRKAIFRIFDRRLNDCIQRRCDKGKIRCVDNCNIRLEVGKGFTLWGARLCVNIPSGSEGWAIMEQMGRTAIHEWAHTCWWFHKKGVGVPNWPREDNKWIWE